MTAGAGGPLGNPGCMAHWALNGKVETLVADVLKPDPGGLGVFDVVFFLGVLYH